jgi:hypothetical protein
MAISPCCEPPGWGSVYFLLKESRSWIRLMGGIQKAEKYQRELTKSKRQQKERVTLSGRNNLSCRCPQRTLPSISGPGARLVPVAETLWWSVGSSTDRTQKNSRIKNHPLRVFVAESQDTKAQRVEAWNATPENLSVT